MTVLVFSADFTLGVCDCCDGSDEKANAFLPAPCANNCEALKSALKKEALANYRHIQAALRARTIIMEDHRQRKLRERKTYDDLLDEKEVHLHLNVPNTGM